MKRYQIKKILLILLLLAISCFWATSLFASDPVRVVIQETVLDQKTDPKTLLSVYGFAEGAEPWQTLSITLGDEKGAIIEQTPKINKRGNWGVEALDISAFADGIIAITAVVKDDRGNIVAQTGSSAVLDTSFSFVEFMNSHFAATIFLLMVILLLLGFPMKIPLIAGATLGVYLLYDGDMS